MLASVIIKFSRLIVRRKIKYRPHDRISMNFQLLQSIARSCFFRLARWIPIIAVPALLSFGCSTTPPTPDGYSSTLNSFRRNAPYNRPYKVKGIRYYPIANPEGYKERGIASWYGSESGNRTAMGVKFRPQALSAAHKTLPLPSRVRVTNLSNGRSVVLIVNDRGPFVKNRLIDLSQGAAKVIGVRGLAKVEVEYLDGPGAE